MEFREVLYAHAVGPVVRIVDRVFREPRAVHIIQSPTYGRVLFSPFVEIRDCVFDVDCSGDPTVLIGDVR